MTHVLDALGRIKEYWGSVALTDLDDYAQGRIIRGGAVDWEAYDASTLGAVLIGTGPDVVSTTTPTFVGLTTHNVGIAVGTGQDIDPADASGQDLGDATHRWDLYTQEVIFGGGAGANIVTIPDAINPSITLVDDGGVPVEFLRIDTVNNEIAFNHLELDVDVRFAALAMTNAFFLRGSDGHIAWGGPSLVVSANWEFQLSDNAAVAMRFIDLGDASDYLTFVTTDGSREVVVNEDGIANMDFRVEWDSGTHALFVQGSDGYLGLSVVPTERVDVLGRTILLGADHTTWLARTNVTDKSGYIVVPHYTNAEESVTVVFAQSFVAENAMLFGGGSVSYNAVNRISFYTAATTTTLTGTERMRITSTGLFCMGPSVVAPDGTVHIHTATAGAVVADAAANDLVIENSTNVGISLLSPAANVGAIAFGSPTSATRGRITYSHSLDAMIFRVASGNRLWINTAGDTYPNAAKAQDLGLATNEWDDIYYVTVHVGTSRLVRSTRTCPVCSTEMSRGTGTTIYRGEAADYAVCFCLNCGNAAVEELNHLSPEKELEKLPPPKIILENVRVKSAGRNRSVAIDFRYGDDALDEIGEVVKQAVRNSTRLGEYEVDEFLAMNDGDRLDFLRVLGEREWYSREETRLMREEAESLKIVAKAKVSSWIGRDLLKEAALPN